ncbi:MAG: hypothetical protein ACK56I_02910, partial [bacterium]
DILSLLFLRAAPPSLCTESESGYPAPPATWQPPLGTSSKTWHNICKRGTPGERARAASGRPRDCLFHHPGLTHECTLESRIVPATHRHGEFRLCHR